SGGAGNANSISGSSATYAGGGGGACWTTGTAGTGGAGGGGNGAVVNSGSNGTANTGGGGGGGGASGNGGSGGSGIVIISYTTPILVPTVSTQAVNNISITTATGNGTITADGGATITERGICWNISTTPTTANSKATYSGTTGAFSTSMTGLNAGTFYYVRAYAINSVGISYGNEVNFTTLATFPTVTTQAVSNIAPATATGNGTVSTDGGATITERGVCWNTSTTPTTANNKTTSTGTTGSFNSSLTGLTPGTHYYVRAYAINSVGISYGNEVNFTTLAPASVDWNYSNVQEITLTKDRTLTFSNGKNGGLYTLIIKQDSNGGWSVTWPSNIKWTGAGTPPVLSTSANAVDVIKFVYDGTDFLETGIYKH
ncbi:MAG: hypothetical protein HGB12_10730, partial [Bacteroidetes bacterium]|nr:hypothetical protein [Bacteroidota bacterium]